MPKAPAEPVSEGRQTPTRPEVSVVVPVFNESGAAADLAREIAAAFAGRSLEILFVDDCSRDDTRARLLALRAEIPALRVLGHGANAGQSRAVRTGVLAAQGDIIVTLDGDGQNDPADAPKLVEALKSGPPELALVGDPCREIIYRGPRRRKR
jgi:glycosyltransferase involved in cell wall biosynthesis